jgi:hypothetical protein
VMGVEPSNSFGIGINRQQSLGVLQTLEPGEHVDYYIEAGVLDGRDEIDAFEREVSQVSPSEPEFASILV